MRIMVIDSAGLYFRAFFGVKDTVTGPDGTPLNAVRGFLDMLTTLVTDRQPTDVVACWDDDWRPAFRVAALPSYKAHRVGEGEAEDSPAELNVQVPIIVSALKALGLARVGVPGFEADDVMATYATSVSAAGGEVEVVTGDRDLLQLVDDEARIRVLYTGKGVRNLDIFDQARLADRYGVATGEAYAEASMMRGDPSDGLPGVKGIGEKTAATLITRFGTLEAIQAQAASGVVGPFAGISATQAANLNAAADYLKAAQVVVRCVRDVPLPSIPTALGAVPPDQAALQAFVAQYGLKSSLDRLLRVIQS